jgi:glycosyltransferase involved in cell wall biosynthesis
LNFNVNYNFALVTINYVVIIVVSEMSLISVIISAHDRRKYLLDAMESCLNQSFPANDYEVIVVKNFMDDEIDEFINKNKFVVVYTDEKTLGQKMAIGIEKSSGSIICFLDDDDKFTSDKLEVISKSFSSINGLGYFHNSLIMIDEEGNPNSKDISVNQESDILIQEITPHQIKEARKYNGDWYMSCISVSRDLALLTLPLLKSLGASFDKIFFYSAILHDMKMMVSSKRLTYYRLHPSLTTIVGDKNMLIKRKTEFFYLTSKAIQSIVPSDNSEKYYILQLAYLHETINYSVLSGKKIGFREYMRFLKLSITIGTPSDRKWAILYAISMFSHGLARNIYLRTMSELYS